MSSKRINDDLISIKYYHEHIEEIFDACLRGEGNYHVSYVSKITESDVMNILKKYAKKDSELNPDFNELLNGLVDPKSDTIEFEFLFVSLGRIVPIVDKLVEMLCLYNIGSDVVSNVNTVKSVRRALAWLYSDSTDAEDAEYQDIQRIQRLVRDVVATNERANGRDVDKSGQINDIVRNINDVVNGANHNTQVDWIRLYKDKTKNLLERTFEYFDYVHKYFDIMRNIDKDAFEEELRAGGNVDKDIKRGYNKILLVAKNVLNVIMRRFVAYAKIRDINFPHAQFAYSDLISVDLSNSNFISANFSYSDLTDTLLRDSDISVANLSYCRARGSDLTNCKLNSSNLVGSDFANASLIRTQMASAKFREQSLDSSVELYGDGNIVDREIQEFFSNRKRFLESLESDEELLGEKCSGLSAHTYGLAKSKIRQFFRKMSLENQDFAKNEITDEWKKTTSGDGDITIGFKHAMDDICSHMEDKLKCVYEVYRMRTVPFKLLYKKDETTQEMRLSPIIDKNSVCFKYATLTGAVMPDADLSYVSFSSAMLNEVDLSGSWFFYTDFTDASLKGANVSNGDYYGVALNSASCTKANFIGSILINCDLNRIDLNNAALINAIVIGTDYGEIAKNEKQAAEIADKRLPYINCICEYDDDSHVIESMDDCAFSESNSMCDANLDGVVGNNAIFAGLNMDRSSWRNAVLKKVSIFNSVARWTYFNGADFSYALLIGVSFHQGSLAHVLMAKSRVYACDMSGVSLNHATLTGSRIERTVFYNADLGGANLSRSNIINCAFSDVDLGGANIGGTLFKNVVFDNVDFSRCVGLDTAKFENCVFGSNCHRLEYPFDAQHKVNRDFMSITQDNIRLKFFRKRTKSADNTAHNKEFEGDRYTSLTFLLNRNK